MKTKTIRTKIGNNSKAEIFVETPLGVVHGQIEMNGTKRKGFRWIQFYNVPTLELNLPSFDRIKTENSNSFAVAMYDNKTSVIL